MTGLIILTLVVLLILAWEYPHMSGTTPIRNIRPPKYAPGDKHNANQ